MKCGQYILNNASKISEFHYNDVIMTTMACQINSLTVVYLTVYSDADQRRHQSSASLAFVWGIHRSRWIPRTKGQLRGKCFYLMTSSCDIISYPLFADADTGIYPHAALQYHARPKAKRGIAMLSVDKFPYPRKQTRGNEFIPCSNNICDILKRFHSFKITAITLIWPKSPYKHSVTRSYRSGKESGRRGRNRHCDVINDVPLSLYLTLMTSNVRYGSIFHGC